MTMTRTKKLFTTLIAIVMIFCTMFAITVPTSAATCSSGTSTRTITVRTKANYWIPGSESITISQSKGVCTKKNYNFLTGKTSYKSTNQYGEWDITVRATDGSHTFYKSLTGGSIKLNLKPNKTYNITITWDSTAATLKCLSKGNYTTYPTWRVKSTYKVSSYY